MISPIIPLFLSSLGASGLVIGFIEGIAKASEHILGIFSGYISDKLKNRKAIIAFGYLISAVMKGAFAFVTNWFEFLLLRILERNGKAIRNPPRDALIVESLTKKETRKGFAIHRILDTLGAIFGPLIAAILIVLLSLNVQTTIELSKFLFVVSMFFGLISVLIVIFFVKEGKMKRKGERLTLLSTKEQNLF
jgi:MFS family permease